MSDKPEALLVRLRGGVYGLGRIELCKEAADEIDRLNAECEQMHGAYGNACKIVADMHAAAMGDVVGPNRGVVEDVADLRSEKERLTAETERMRRVLEEINRITGLPGADVGRVFRLSSHALGF